MFKRIQKMLKNKKGFTLVELIVVIAILGILATIAIPKYSGMRNKAEQVADEQAIVAMNKSIKLYAVEKDNDGPTDATTLKEALKLAYDDIPDVKASGKAFYYDESAYQVKLLEDNATNDGDSGLIKIPTDFLD